MTRRLPATLALLVVATLPAVAADFPAFEAREIDPKIGNVCYALAVADIDGDGKPDVVGVSEDAVVWYRNPTWEKADILRGTTEKDNVCIQAHDIDGDGRIDLTLGAGWKPSDTSKPSTLQWLGRDKEGRWQLHPIRCDEPTLHRIRWADVKGNGRKQLLVSPLQGRGAKGPNWGNGPGVNLVVYDVPADPTSPDWPAEVADSSLHTMHNIWPANLDDDRADEILVAAWEGVFALDRGADGNWRQVRIGGGNQESTPNKGASEIKLGRTSDGRPFVATIEPWHGNQFVVYSRPDWKSPADLLAIGKPADRRVVAEPLAWGHAVWCADLDGDGGDEIVVGQRDPNAGDARPKGPGIFAFDPRSAAAGLAFDRHTIDDGGMACEDALTADLDGDGRPEIIAGGRATHNVKIYWNKPSK